METPPEVDMIVGLAAGYAVTPGPRKTKGKSGAEGIVMLVLAFILVSAIAVPAMILGPKIMGLLVLLGSIWLLAWSLAKSMRKQGRGGNALPRDRGK